MRLDGGNPQIPTLIRLSSRKSDLARLQAYAVADALRAIGVSTQFQFRESLGDKNLNDALWKMPEKGVFTEDFYLDLVEGRTDCVVHSWKDLPIEVKPETEIVATLARAAPHDVLLLKRERLNGPRRLAIFSSSPRRAYNLSQSLPPLLPFEVSGVEFHPVRGNISTRVRKCFETDSIDGIVVAQAALDRLLTATAPDLLAGGRELAEMLRAFRFIVLPLKLNPTAAAQGALAIEIKRDRDDLRALFSQIHRADVFAAVEFERRTLKKYGGGCHQKIGASLLSLPFGEVFSLRGLTDSGLVLNEFSLRRERDDERFSMNEIFPRDPSDANYFDREEIHSAHVHAEIAQSDANSYLVSRANAWPRGFIPSEDSVVYAAGLSTWQQLARQGVFVSGCLEGLGESMLPDLGPLAGSERRWIKFAHDQSQTGMKQISTYRLIAKTSVAPIGDEIRACYWMSASSFEQALRQNPRLLEKRHFCGPGNTYDGLKRRYGDVIRLEVELGFEEFKKEWVRP